MVGARELFFGERDRVKGGDRFSYIVNVFPGGPKGCRSSHDDEHVRANKKRNPLTYVEVTTNPKTLENQIS